MTNHNSVDARADLRGRFNENVEAEVRFGSSTTSCSVRQDKYSANITCAVAFPEQHGILVAKSCSDESGTVKCSDDFTKPFYTGNLKRIQFMNYHTQKYEIVCNLCF